MKKEVDRKASKHRKIRYVVHDKLVNFMTPLDNLSTIFDGKDSILTSLFGQRPQ
jgi:protein AATF/BFR2